MTIERIDIENREQWLALRRQDVTASVAGALLGVHPYATAFGLYLLKSGQVAEDAEETPPMRRGRLLEPVAVQMLREDCPEWEIYGYPTGLYLRDPDARLGATPDLIVSDENDRRGVVQIKTVEPGVFRRDWKDDAGFITPPLWIVVQAIIEAYLTESEWAAVAPMVVGFGVEMPIIPVPIHAGIIDRIKAEVAVFWERVAQQRPYDPDYARDGSLIAKLFPRDHGGEIDLSADNRAPFLADELVRAKTELKAAEKRKETIENEIKVKLGENTLGRLGDGRMLSWKLQQRASYVAKATEFRVLRIIEQKRAS